MQDITMNLNGQWVSLPRDQNVTLYDGLLSGGLLPQQSMSKSLAFKTSCWVLKQGLCVDACKTLMLNCEGDHLLTVDGLNDLAHAYPRFAKLLRQTGRWSCHRCRSFQQMMMASLCWGQLSYGDYQKVSMLVTACLGCHCKPGHLKVESISGFYLSPSAKITCNRDHCLKEC